MGPDEALDEESIKAAFMEVPKVIEVTVEPIPVE
jgi:hypothetical protein